MRAPLHQVAAQFMLKLRVSQYLLKWYVIDVTASRAYHGPQSSDARGIQELRQQIIDVAAEVNSRSWQAKVAMMG